MDIVFSLDCFMYFSSCPCNLREEDNSFSFKFSKEILYWIVMGTVGRGSLQLVNKTTLTHHGEMQIHGS